MGALRRDFAGVDYSLRAYEQDKTEGELADEIEAGQVDPDWGTQVEHYGDRWKDEVDGSLGPLLVIDEAHKCLGGDELAENPHGEAIIRFFAEHRHYKFHIVLVTQHHMSIHPEIRRRIERFYRCSRLSSISLDGMFRVHLYEKARDLDRDAPSLYAKTYKYSKDVWKYYKSTVDGGADFRPKMTPLLLRPQIAVPFCIAALLALWSVPKLMDSRMFGGYLRGGAAVEASVSASMAQPQNVAPIAAVPDLPVPQNASPSVAPGGYQSSRIHPEIIAPPPEPVRVPPQYEIAGHWGREGSRTYFFQPLGGGPIIEQAQIELEGWHVQEVTSCTVGLERPGELMILGCAPRRYNQAPALSAERRPARRQGPISGIVSGTVLGSALSAAPFGSGSSARNRPRPGEPRDEVEAPIPPGHLLSSERR
jgi:hypothetical protein